MSWLTKITSVMFMDPPIGDQVVKVSYREFGSGSAFTTPDLIIFKPDATISGTPNPYIISGISDAWAAIEVKIVNNCDILEVLQKFSKP